MGSAVKEENEYRVLVVFLTGRGKKNNNRKECNIKAQKEIRKFYNYRLKSILQKP
jgi:hypothetical protein